MFDISSRAEKLLEQIGVPWNGWQYEAQDFIEINSELAANGVPTYKTFEDFLEARLEYKQRKVA